MSFFENRQSNPGGGELLRSDYIERLLNVTSAAEWSVTKTVDGWQQLISRLISVQVELVLNRIAESGKQLRCMLGSFSTVILTATSQNFMAILRQLLSNPADQLKKWKNYRR